MDVRHDCSMYGFSSIATSQGPETDIDFDRSLQCLYQNRSVESFLKHMEIVNPSLLEYSRWVTYYSLLIARSLEFGPKQKRIVQNSALLHDVGMMDIDKQLIQKGEKLTSLKLKLIRAHPTDGVKLLSRFPFFHEIIPIVKHHHEWYDGTGYPDGLRGNDIPLMSRIIAIADAFVAMTSDRTYRDRWTTHEALVMIEDRAGTQFDSRFVGMFITIVTEKVECSSAKTVGIPDGWTP